jgi:uncharacterized protein
MIKLQVEIFIILKEKQNMNQNWMQSDRVLSNINQFLEKCAGALSIEVLSVVLYGSRARGDRNSQNDYEFLVLVGNDTKLKSYIRFINIMTIELLKEKIFQVKIQVYTPDVFEEVLYNDKIAGSLLYMICKENMILYDKFGTFTSIKERMLKNNNKDEGVFINQCIEFSRMLGSEKWERKWEKTLMQYKYLKQRREFY